MKKNGIALIAILASLPAFGLTVTYLEGSAELVKNNSHVPLKMKSKLAAGDVIQTAAASNVEIGSKEQFKIKILELSRFTVTDLAEGATVKFDAGNILVKVSKEWKAKHKVTIVTPTSTASIRGTEFWGQVKPTNDTHLSTFAVREGTIEFTLPWKKEPLLVSTGEAVVVDTKEQTALVRKALPGELSAMQPIEKMDFKE